MEYGILSLLPVCVALVLAFVTKDALLSILIGVLTGIIVSGQNIVTGFTGILQSALGNADFIWILAIEVFVGIVAESFDKFSEPVDFGGFPFCVFKRLVVRLLFLRQKRRVVALVSCCDAVLDFVNDADDAVQKHTVVRHNDDRIFIVFKVSFQPLHRGDVKVVRGLVQK